MQMLGPQSMSAFLRAGLGLFSGLLWALVALVTALASGYAGAMIAIHIGWLKPIAFSSRHITLNVDGAEKDFLAWPSAVALFAGLLVALFATIFIVRRLKAMFDTFIINDPFRAENGAHLRAIGFWLIGLQFIHVLSYYVELVLEIIARQGKPRTIDLSLSVNSETLALWFVIAVLFVLAEVFREGAKMRAEQNLTV